MTSRHYCFTLYSDNAPFNGIHQLPSDDDTGLRYGVYQLERCPTSQRLHWQGYAEFFSPIRTAQAVRLIGTGAHVERRKGTRDQARDYCMDAAKRAPGTEPIELGDWSRGGPGKRTDIADALTVIRANPSASGLESLYDDHGVVMVKYSKGMANAMQHYRGRISERPVPEVYVHYGPTGTGKTYTVYNRHSVSTVWRAPVSTNNIQWFDGYYGQKVALFDDFDGAHPAITVMLQVLDRYNVQVPVKGSHTFFNPEVIYITTNLPFDEWYPDASDIHKAALKRRVSEFIQFEYIQYDRS